MIKKFKKTVKKAKGIEEKIHRLEFYDRLKNGKPAPTPDLQSAKEILDKIRNRNKPSPYDAGADRGIMKRLRIMAGLE